MNTAPSIRYFEIAREQGNDEEKEANETIRGLNEHKDAIERAIEFEKQKQIKEEATNQQLTDWKLENDRRRSLLITLQNLDVQRRVKEIEELKKNSKKIEANEDEHAKEMMSVRVKEIEVSIRKFVDSNKLRAQTEEIEKKT